MVLLATSGVPQDASGPARVWACGRGSGVYGVLSGLGVAVELREYTTVVKGRAYRRCLVLVRDLKLLERVVRAARRGELAKLVRRGWRAAAEALASLSKLRNWGNLVKALPRPLLLRVLGVRPRDWGIYRRWEGTRILRAVWSGVGRAKHYFVRRLRRELEGAALEGEDAFREAAKRALDTLRKGRPGRPGDRAWRALLGDAMTLETAYYEYLERAERRAARERVLRERAAFAAFKRW